MYMVIRDSHPFASERLHIVLFSRIMEDAIRNQERIFLDSTFIS